MMRRWSSIAASKWTRYFTHICRCDVCDIGPILPSKNISHELQRYPSEIYLLPKKKGTSTVITIELKFGQFFLIWWLGKWHFTFFFFLLSIKFSPPLMNFLGWTALCMLFSKMQVIRRFCFMAMIGLIMILSIAILVSIGQNFSFLNHKQWLSRPGDLAKRQSSITLTIPW